MKVTNFEKKVKTFLSLLLVTLALTSCIKIDQFEKTAQIPSGRWFYMYTPDFTFHISDTSASYNVYVTVRHTDAYQYSNLWVRIGTKFPGDSMHFENVNLILGNDAKGWEGTGTGDIFEVRKIISRGEVPFKKEGNYVFSIAQIMRENPLENVLSVGIRLEKSGQ